MQSMDEKNQAPSPIGRRSFLAGSVAAIAGLA
jgi:hypothetical protein